jgi:hypothetical protein
MLKKILLSAALAAGLATVSVASIVLGAYDQGAEVSISLDVSELMAQSGNLPDRTPVDLL